MITTQTLTTGIHAFFTQKIKELDMQLRKPATAILALALSAGLAQADDAAAWQLAIRWTKSPKRRDCRRSP